MTKKHSVRTKRGNRHDNYFRGQFGNRDSARALLKVALSERQLEQIDLDSVRIESVALPDAGDVDTGFGDLVVSARLKSGGGLTFALIVEHKSRPDKYLMRQLLGYIAAIYAQDESVAVLPVTIYNGKSLWQKEKSFFSFHHADLPTQFLSDFGPHLINFVSVFVSLREAKVRSLVNGLPPRERLALQAMTNVWGAGTSEFIKFMEEADAVDENVRGVFIRRTFKYLSNNSKSFTIENVKQALSPISERDEAMQESMDLWLEQELPEIVSRWKSKAQKQGIELGKKSEKREIAMRLMDQGMSDCEIGRATGLALDQVQALKNGG